MRDEFAPEEFILDEDAAAFPLNLDEEEETEPTDEELEDEDDADDADDLEDDGE
jgi:hypothetical protein